MDRSFARESYQQKGHDCVTGQRPLGLPRAALLGKLGL
jgi:hypothetical protein